MFQNLILPSSDPLAIIVPVLLKATAVILSLKYSLLTNYSMYSFSYRLAIVVLVSTFQSLILLSFDPLARIVPVLLKATVFTLP